MKRFWHRDAVRILPTKIDLSKQPWCREAVLLEVRGNGALRWESRDAAPDPDNYDSCRCLTLRGTPLLSGRFPECETSVSWLSAGWGVDAAGCPELDDIHQVLNAGFSRLEAAAEALSPLLELLPEGLYVLAEGGAYPADGSGRFFWDVTDHPQPCPATGLVSLSDDDYDCRYEHLPPVFLYPSQRRSRLDMARVAYYQERFRQGGSLPHGIALHVTEGLSVLLDGHHKAAAAALLGRALPCLTVLPLQYYQTRIVTVPPRHVLPVIPRRYEKYAACFGPVTIPLADMGGISQPQNIWFAANGSGPLPAGHLADAELPEALQNAGRRYPTAEGYALVCAAEIAYPTDEELESWLAAPDRCRPQLRAALVLLKSRGDARLKDAALRCAAAGDAHCSLKAEAFHVLAEMKGDKDAEDFFINYFVSLDAPHGIHGSAQDDLTEIAHSFWR